MLSKPTLLTLCVFFAGISAFPTIQAANGTNACPMDTEYACFDVINSSLCLSQAAVNGTAAQMAACVTYQNAMSDLPGAFKVSTS
jgi:hypothetical protein